MVKMEKVKLGNTNLYASKFGMGALAIGPSHRNLSVEEGSDVICYAVKKGINVIDTAQAYDTYSYVAAAIKKLRKENLDKDLIISSKSLAQNYSDMEKAVNDVLDKLDIECIDIFFMHEVRSGQFEERFSAWQALIDAKKAGKIKAIGVSTHHTDIVSQMANVKECDIVFGLINYKGMGIRTGLTTEEISKIDERERRSTLVRHRCLDREGTTKEMEDAIHKLKESGKAFYAMKAFGGGNLLKEYTEALDYVYNNKEIDSILIGYGSKEEVDNVIDYEKGTLQSDFIPNYMDKTLHVNRRDCEGCGRCIKTCPQGAISFGLDGLAEVDRSKCLTCGYCAMVCPNRAIIMF